MSLEPDQGLRQLLTRRQFFGRTAAGIGTAALASLLNERLFAAAGDPLRTGAGALPALHFAPKAKRVIYLFMSGGPSHIDLFDYKPKLQGAPRRGAARLGPHGPAHHRHDHRARSRSRASRRCSSSRSTASAAPGSASCCRTSATIADDIAIVKSLQHRGDQPRPGHHLHPDRPPAAGPAEPRAPGSATAWAARTRTCRRSSS